eukprot:6491846-Amphidinium_carterae.1
MDLMTILSATEDELVHTCLDHGMLVDMKGKICPTCKCGTLGPLSSARRGVLNYRCNRFACQTYHRPWACHPFFTCARGPTTHTFKMQCAVLMASLSGCTHVTMKHLFKDINHKVFERMQTRLQSARAAYVKQKEPTIKMGTKRAWKDVEADEVLDIDALPTSLR